MKEIFKRSTKNPIILPKKENIGKLKKYITLVSFIIKVNIIYSTER